MTTFRTIMSARSAAMMTAGISLVLGACTSSDRGTRDSTIAGKRDEAAIPIAIQPVVPTDIAGGAPNAGLDQAAAFAWQEFIALNWPATTTGRDTPDTACRFGGCGARQLTWETFRGKVEIYSPAAARQNYSDPPRYEGIYSTGPLERCVFDELVRPSAWVNLDETTEIGLAAMYAGVNQSAPGENSQPRLIRFAAKANRAEFNAVHPEIGTTVPQGPSFSLPARTIEIKAAWRLLTPAEVASRRFHTARVRYYETVAGASVTTAPGQQQPQLCWKEADGTWGLVGLHIIQKTESAPYFIYATFEQADNILTRDGARVEDAEGRPNRRGLTRYPTEPATRIFDSATPVGQDGPPLPPQVQLQPNSAANCRLGTKGQADQRLNYQNEAITTAVPRGGYICVNNRAHAIPAQVIAANQQAHDAIRAYNEKYGVSSPWTFYKLINVQFRPLTKTAPGVTYSGPDASTYYLANSVIETNATLQNFSGLLVPFSKTDPSRGFTGAGSDYAIHFGVSDQPNPPPPSTPRTKSEDALVYNVRTPIQGTSGYFTMGGCMGCHGHAKILGGDFSFMAALRDPVYPDALPINTAGGVIFNAPRLDALRRRPPAPARPTAATTPGHRARAPG